MIYISHTSAQNASLKLGLTRYSIRHVIVRNPDGSRDNGYVINKE